jgi:hypothetical protein
MFDLPVLARESADLARKALRKGEKLLSVGPRLSGTGVDGQRFAVPD